MSEERTVTMSKEAAAKLSEFVSAADSNGNSKSGDDNACLRLGIIGGGCSGYQYQLALDYPSDDDHTFESQGQKIAVKAEAYPLVAGSEIVYRDELLNAGFDVENPNATAACGCGSSFRVDPNASGCSE